jgi:hypothetical protein
MSVLGACVNEPFEECSFHTRLGGVDLLERSVWNQCFLFLLRLRAPKTAPSRCCAPTNALCVTAKGLLRVFSAPGSIL